MNERDVPNKQAVALSGLNVLQVLAENAPTYLDTFRHYGPSSFAGKTWAAALIWFHRKGYHSYQKLKLCGIWAIEKTTQIHLCIGVKSLVYSVPIFNPEAYYQMIRKDFRFYYDDDGSPPPEAECKSQIVYDPARRLALRQEVSDAIIALLRQQNT